MKRAFLLASVLIGCSSSKSGGDAQPPAEAGVDSSVESCFEAPTDDGRTTVAAAAPYRQYVNTFIGTGGIGFGTGSTFPGPQAPFGMARPGPDTTGPGGAPGFAHCVGYAYEDSLIYGFSQTRLHGIGIVDAGAIGLMPTRKGMTAAKTANKGRRASFSHKNEQASPGYYRVKLDDGIEAELTATDHVGWQRFTFPAEADATLLLDVGHTLTDVTIIDGSLDVDVAKQEMSGFAHYKGGYSGRFGGVPVYFVARFDRAFEKSGVWKAGALAEGELSRKGGDVGAWISFDASKGDPAKATKVTVAVGLSFVSVEGARKNLDAEAKTLDFDAARAATEAAWEDKLSRLKLEARSKRDLTIAYSALYHTLLMPTLATDVDGQYRGLDKLAHAADGYRYYTDFSLWDTYRTLHPWLTLVYPEYQRDFLRSMTAMAKENGAPPKWPLGIGETQGMVGDSAAVVFGDSVAKGLRDFDMKGAYEVLKKSALGPLPRDGRDNVDVYAAKGWIGIEEGSSSGSKTLEYAYDDFALAQVADALGEKADADLFRKRGGNWKNLWDGEFLLARRKDGSFPRDDDKTAWQDYWAEGTTWNYTWFVPQDLPGLAEVMGGKQKFLQRIDDYFANSTCQPKSRLAPKAYYWHSNEPVLFVPWAYAELDEPARGARWVRWALADNYGDGPDGLPGNDDGGTMSAWYLFSSLGLFPRVGFTDYLVGTPLFPKATLKLPAGELTITAGATSAVAYVPSKVTWKGAALARPRIEHADLIKGGALDFTLAPEK